MLFVSAFEDGRCAGACINSWDRLWLRFVIICCDCLLCILLWYLLWLLFVDMFVNTLCECIWECAMRGGLYKFVRTSVITCWGCLLWIFLWVFVVIICCEFICDYSLCIHLTMSDARGLVLICEHICDYFVWFCFVSGWLFFEILFVIIFRGYVCEYSLWMHLRMSDARGLV